MNKKRWVFVFYFFDPKTKQLEAIERSRTKAMTEKDFDKLLGKRIKDNKNAIWTVETRR